MVATELKYPTFTNLFSHFYFEVKYVGREPNWACKSVANERFRRNRNQASESVLKSDTRSIFEFLFREKPKPKSLWSYCWYVIAISNRLKHKYSVKVWLTRIWILDSWGGKECIYCLDLDWSTPAALEMECLK